MNADAREEIKGEFLVTTRLALGSERLKLFLTNSRVVVAHIGKRGTAALATASFFGKLGTALEDVLKSSRESFRNRKAEEHIVEKILADDKDNFSIEYRDIVSVVLSPTPHMVMITVLTKDDKVEFWTTADYESLIHSLRELLGDEVVSTHP